MSLVGDVVRASDADPLRARCESSRRRVSRLLSLSKPGPLGRIWAVDQLIVIVGPHG